MAEEYLEGVLDDATLDELAEDLGISPDVMRKHPFFRVLKGRILLTYPLKSSVACFEYQPPATLLQLNPAAGTYYTVLPETENVILKYLVLYHDAGVNKQVGARLTIDEVVYENFNVAMPTAELQYASVTESQVGATTWAYGATRILVGGLDTLEGKSVKVEAKANNDLGAGKTLYSAVYWGKLV